MAGAEPRQVISRLAPSLVERLDAYAKREGLSRNAAVERLLTDGLAAPVVKTPSPAAKPKAQKGRAAVVKRSRLDTSSVMVHPSLQKRKRR